MEKEVVLQRADTFDDVRHGSKRGGGCGGKTLAKVSMEILPSMFQVS